MGVNRVSEGVPLSILVIEDDALISLQLQMLIEDCGHEVVGCASAFDEARNLADKVRSDLALVDIHLADGPTGTAVAEHLHHRDVPVVFMTANAKRVPEDFDGAIGIMAKPYTANSVRAALHYLHAGVRNPPPLVSLPTGLMLSPAFSARWSSHA